MKIEDIRGGMRVKVVARADGMLDANQYMGRVGWVDGFDPDTCGSTEQDPMLFVRFPGKKIDGFWLEELEAA